MFLGWVGWKISSEIKFQGISNISVSFTISCGMLWHRTGSDSSGDRSPHPNSTHNFIPFFTQTSRVFFSLKSRRPRLFGLARGKNIFYYFSSVVRISAKTFCYHRARVLISIVDTSFCLRTDKRWESPKQSEVKWETKFIGIEVFFLSSTIKQKKKSCKRFFFSPRLIGFVWT